MTRKKKSEDEEQKESSLVSEQDFVDNLNEAIDNFCDAWRVAISPTEPDVEDFDVMRVRNALGVYRTPEGFDAFPKIRRVLAQRGYVFRSAFGTEVMFLVPRSHDLRADLADYQELNEDGNEVKLLTTEEDDE